MASSGGRLLGSRLCSLLLGQGRAAAASAGAESKFGGGWARRALSGAPQEAAKAAPAAAAAASEAKKPGMNPFAKVMIVGLGVGGAYVYTLYSSRESMPQNSVPAFLVNTPKPNDYGAVRKAIAGLLDEEGYDDGSFGPIFVRLAWHASGTYDKTTRSGGSDGATMRFSPECEHGANAGLEHARKRLEPLKAQFPWISYADLWTLAGVVAVEEMGGPVVPWRPGRSDKPDGNAAPPDGRLPDASKGSPHIRDIFYRMGFDDREIVALSGAHTLGRCHTDRSGYSDRWTNAPTTFSNLYFNDLLNTKWVKRKWNGPLQYQDPSKELMMLPTDMALLWDKKFKKYVELYAKDEEVFFKDFAAAFSKLLELGVPFEPAPPAAA